MATKREEYIAKLKTQLDQWNAEMAKWESQAAQAQANMREEYEKQLAAIRQRQEQAKEHLRKVQRHYARLFEDAPAAEASRRALAFPPDKDDTETLDKLAAMGFRRPLEVSQAVRAFSEFYDLYLNRRMTPGEVLQQHPEWKDLWYDTPEGQYGRPATFYQQLQGLNLGQAWQEVDAPVLVIHGTKDDIMSRADAEAIAETVNRVHPGRARYLEVEGMTHGFTINRKFDDDLIPTILNWMKEQLATSSGAR